MNLTNFFTTFFGFIFRLVDLLRSATFSAFGYSVSYFDVVIVFLFIFMVVSFFWKGAKA